MPTTKRPVIIAQKRSVTGRKIKSLRRQGILPANLYGKKIKSVCLSLSTIEFEKLFHKVGETSLIDLTIAEDKSVHPVLISAVQYHPVTDRLLHVDLREVDLTEKVTANIPIKIIGESPAVKDKGAVLVTVISEIEVEALPADLPDHIQIDVSSLAEFNDAIHVKDLKFAKGVEVKIELDAVVATVQEPKEEKEEAPAVVAPVTGEAVAPVAGAVAPVADGEKKSAEAGKPAEAKPSEANKAN